MADETPVAEELRRRPELLQAVFDHIPVMIAISDQAGRLLLANREWERVSGWTTAEAQRLDVLAETYPDPAVRRQVLEFMRRAERVWRDFTMRTRSGKEIVASWARFALSDGTTIGFGRDVTEHRRNEERLRQSRDQLQALLARLRAAREEEATRIAREVHDEIGQLLTALRLDVSWLESRLAADPEAAREELAAKLGGMSQLLDSASDAVARVAGELRPGLLDKLGFEAAAEWYVEELARRTGIACTLRSTLGGAEIAPDHATALFRILQEALTNVARHSGATHVEIRLAAEPGRVVLAVLDDGRGIPEAVLASTSGAIGLLGMRERAQAVGGDVVVRRRPAGGTAVEASLPR